MRVQQEEKKLKYTQILDPLFFQLFFLIKCKEWGIKGGENTIVSTDNSWIKFIVYK